MNSLAALVATFGVWLGICAVLIKSNAFGATVRLTRVALVWTTSWALVGFLIWVAGWLRILYAPIFVVGGALGSATAVFVAVQARRSRRKKADGTDRSGWRHEPLTSWVLWAVGVVAVGTTMLGALRWPYGGDEKDYKWVAPLAWAHAHHFFAIPYRLSNGFNLAEYLSVPSATVRVLVVARIVQVVLLVGLGLSAAALADRVGAASPAPLWVGVSAVSMPVALLAAKQVGSDLAAAAFLVTATLAYISLVDGRRIGSYALLTAAAVSAKVIVVPEVLVMTILLVVMFGEHRGSAAARAVAQNSLGLTLALVVGFVHTFVLTGHFVANNVRSLYPSGSPFLATGAAAGRIPSIADLLFLPVVPFATGIVGQREPYGGRTGLPLLIGLPIAAAMAIVARRRPARLNAMLAIGAASYLVMAPVFIKTRFLLTVWIFFLIASALAVECLIGEERQRHLRAAWLVALLIAVSALDPVRVIARTVL